MTNEAFDEVNIPSHGPEDNIRSILLYHVFNQPAELEDGNIYSMLINAMVFISVSTMNETRVNDSKIIQSIAASNALVYSIDAILLCIEAPSNSPSESSSETTTQVGTVEPLLDKGNERTLGPMAEAPSSKITYGSPSELPSDRKPQLSNEERATASRSQFSCNYDAIRRLQVSWIY
jgi:hypothetical protein